jgi:hypothetical protein
MVRHLGDEGVDDVLKSVRGCAGGIYRIENAEVRNCGQASHLGRYCIHYHMASDESQSYARSNSIHNSYQRAITLHGTNYASVTGNAAYHILGHSIFVEDGVEQYNVVEENLVAITLATRTSLVSDTTPASFWMASPTNFWRHNVAAGSAHSGFWFELRAHPGGASYTTTLCPVRSDVTLVK